MIQLFKKKKTSREIIEEIHNSFTTSSERLVNEALEIINKTDQNNVDKGLKLKQLGFTQAQQVKEAEKTLNSKKMAETLATQINYYKMKYPFNKFITEEELFRICDKYALVLGDTNLYKGFVPQKNIEEIEKFELKHHEDLPEDEIIVIKKLDFYRNTDNLAIKKLIKYLQSINNLIKVPKDRSAYLASYNSYNMIKECLPSHLSEIVDRISNVDFETLGDNLVICAPKSQMDLSQFVIYGNKNKLKVEYTIDKDPVVLKRVKHGYLIVTMWADEEFDPSVEESLRNDTMNN